MRTRLLVAGGIVLLGATFALGLVVGGAQPFAHAEALCVINGELKNTLDFEPFWKTWELLDEHYVGHATTSSLSIGQERLWGAISGMVASVGDPYTVFLPPEEKKNFDDDVRGNFGGIGIEIGVRNNKLSVIAPLEGTPADRAGLRAGDSIIAIGATSTDELSIERAVSLIRGPVGTPVILTITREGLAQPLQVPLVRAIITIPTLKSELLPGNIFVITLYNFSEQSPKLFREALQRFSASGSTKLILDLRNNPGGYLDAAVDISSWFLPEGAVVVRESIGPEKRELIHRSVRRGIFGKNLRMVILINEGSASAAEIVAGALREHGVAQLVGEKTFGKGSVQELIPVTRDTSLKVTTAEWLTPKGTALSGRGLTPDVVVSLEEKDVQADRDPQRERAIQILAQ